MTSLSHIQDMLTTAKYPDKQDNFYLKVQITFIPAFSHWGCRSTHLHMSIFFFFSSSLSIFAISPIIFSRDSFVVSDDGITLELLFRQKVTLLNERKVNLIDPFPCLYCLL